MTPPGAGLVGEDDRSGGYPFQLPVKTLRPLTRREPPRALAQIAVEWTSMVAAVVAAEASGHPLAYLLAVVWIGARQHALVVLAHDGVHGLLLRDRLWNRRVTELLVAWPVLLAFRSYRRIHLLHHRHLNTERDPDWARNRPDRLQVWRGWPSFVTVMLGLEATQRELRRWIVAGERAQERVAGDLSRLAYYVAAVGLAWQLGGLSLLGWYWIVPLVTWFPVSMRLRGTAEHFAVENAEAANFSRTVQATFLERMLVAPRNSSYHIEHHLYPGVPHHRLPALHKELMALPAFRARAHVTRGYLAFLAEAARAGGQAAAPSVARS